MNRNDPTDRFYFAPAVSTPLCNECKNLWRGTSACSAYPNGIPLHVLKEKTSQKKAGIGPGIPCGGVEGVCYVPIDQK